MKGLYILALDSSAVSASCCIVKAEGENVEVVSSGFVNVGLTHSKTLLPLVEDTVKNSALELPRIDYIAITQGPGSFTGVRIGIATVKGIAFANNTPCVGVSTLDAIAKGCSGLKGTVCAVMDARRDQVYNAVFKNGKTIKRLTEDRAISIEELMQELSSVKGDIWLAGDGAAVCYAKMKGDARVRIAPPALRYQNAVGAALAAIEKINKDQFVSQEKLLPTYLRLPQAERELNNKKKLS